MNDYVAAGPPKAARVSVKILKDILHYKVIQIQKKTFQSII